MPLVSPQFPALLQRVSTLDVAQAAAFQRALTSSVGLIQGPPGTGKTFLGVLLAKALIDNGVKKPILTVCYTNHALDQFLEALLDKDITRIARLGGGTKSERLLALEPPPAPEGPGDRRRMYDANDAVRKAYGSLHATTAKLVLLRQGRPSLEMVLDVLLSEQRFAGILDSILTYRGGGWADEEDSEDAITDEECWRAWRRQPAPNLQQAAAAPSVKGKQKQQKGKEKNTGRTKNPFAALEADRVDAAQKEHAVLSVIRKLLEAARDRRLTLSHLGEKIDRKLLRAHQFKTMKMAVLAFPQQLLLDVDSGQVSLVADGDAQAAMTPAQHRLAGVHGRAWELTHEDRQRLVDELCVAALRGDGSKLTRELRKAISDLREAHSRLQAERADRSRRSLEQCQVVGVTTSYAAKNLSLLRALGAHVVLCEEAAEVLEAHLLACLSDHTQQLILIGDHFQLRPKIEQHDLTCESRAGYRLDLSLFERLVSDQRLSHSCLTTQWRMRPQIAELPRRTLYPGLLDSPTVANHPAVRGMRENLWFLDHEHPQTGGGGGDADSVTSHVNPWEAVMVVRFVKYLQEQGYKPSQLTVLTPYLGQLSALMKELRQLRVEVLLDENDQVELEALEGAPNPAAAGAQEESDDEDSEEEPGKKNGNRRPVVGVTKALKDCVRLATVDNFQGEESDVVLVSLVRCNQNGRIGFLKSPNRVNVLLTRARHGLYLFGSRRTLLAARNAPGNPWPSIFREVLARLHGPDLPLRCARHPGHQANVGEPAEFDEWAHDGGCQLACQGRLDCGHTCRLLCHPTDLPHRTSSHCREKCARVASGCVPQSHTCPVLCSVNPCPPCAVPTPVTLPCGHCCNLPCHRTADLAAARCVQPLELPSASGCAHKVKVLCHARQEPVPACSHPCERPLLCGHACSAPCHYPKPCGSCQASCSRSCLHSQCRNACKEPCALCVHECPWKACAHQAGCPLPCGAPCLRLPCDHRCSLKLRCGHRCPGLCGDPCVPPDWCVECGAKRNEIVDLYESRTAAQVVLAADITDQEPLVLLSCGHALARTSADGVAELSNYYRQTSDGWQLSVLPDPNAAELKMPLCHLCRAPFDVRTSRRYSRLLNHLHIQVAQRKWALHRSEVSGQLAADIARLEEEVGRLEQRAADSGISRPAPAPGAAALRPPGAAVPVPAEPAPVQPKCAESAAAAVLLKKADERAAHLLGQSLKLKNHSTAPLQKLYELTTVALNQLRAATASPAPAPAASSTPRVPLELLQPCVPVPDHLLESRAAVCMAQATALQMRLVPLRGIITLPAAEGDRAQLLPELLRLREAAVAELGRAEQAARQSTAVRQQALILRCLFATQAAAVRSLHLIRGRLVAAADATRLRDLQKDTLETLAEYLERLCQLHKQHAFLAAQGEGLAAVEAELKALTTLVRDGGAIYLPVTTAEKKEIFAAMGLSLAPGSFGGHWFQCQNGHIYAIGECGGAMQASRCPECGAGIGGGNHRLDPTNRRATDFTREVSQ